MLKYDPVPLRFNILNRHLMCSVLIASVPSQEKLLRQKAQRVTPEDIANSVDIRQAESELHAALQTFRDTHGFGRAIAAPQIGYHLRMIALNLGEVFACYASRPPRPKDIYHSV